MRVADLKKDNGTKYEDTEFDGDDGWLLAVGDDEAEEIPDMDIPDLPVETRPPPIFTPSEPSAKNEDEDSEDIPDIDDFSDSDLEEDDPVCRF